MNTFTHWMRLPCARTKFFLVFLWRRWWWHWHYCFPTSISLRNVAHHNNVLPVDFITHNFLKLLLCSLFHNPNILCRVLPHKKCWQSTQKQFCTFIFVEFRKYLVLAQGSQYIFSVELALQHFYRSLMCQNWCSLIDDFGKNMQKNQ